MKLQEAKFEVPTAKCPDDDLPARSPGPERGLFPSEGQVSSPIGLIGTLWGMGGCLATLTALGVDVSNTHVAMLTLSLIVVTVIFKFDLKKIVCGAMISIADIFFKEIGCYGLCNVPQNGPVLFAIGPHNNQFVDPVMVMSCAPQRPDIGFIVAAKTMRRKFVGKITRVMSCIPVERQEDIAKSGPGKVVVKGDTLHVEGGTFTERVFVGDSIFVRGARGSVSVSKIIDSHSLQVQGTFVAEPKGASTYKVAPKVDTASFFSSVVERLNDGQAIGIFPEGGSHDQTCFINIKPGIALIALGAAAKHDLQVPIVPIGLNYFKAHRFRSRVLVEFGAPIFACTHDLVEEYRKGGEARREAVAAVMEKVRDGMCSVTVQAPDYKTLQLFWALRRLYTPSTLTLTVQDKQRLVRGFAEGYAQFKDHPQVLSLVSEVTRYMAMLKELGLHDYQAQKNFVYQEHAKRTLLWRIGLIAFWICCGFPAVFINLPFYLVSRRISQRKAAEAAQSSTVKIAGRDVLASWKVLVGMGFVPLLHIFYTTVAYLWLGYPQAVGYFFFMPYIAYTGVRAQERVWKIVRSLRPLVLSIWDPQMLTEVAELRAKCAAETVVVVEEVGWGHSIASSIKRSPLPRTHSASFGVDVFATEPELPVCGRRKTEEESFQGA